MENSEQNKGQLKEQFTIPYKVRFVLYILTGVLSPLVAYLLAKGYIGPLEVAFWGAEVTFVMALAGFNTQPNSIEKRNELL